MFLSPLSFMRISLRTASAALSLLVPFIASAAGLQVIVNGRALTFTDVSVDAWYATYVQQAAEANIISGYSDSRGQLTGKFGPNKSITMAETLKIAVEGAGYDETMYGSVIDSGVKKHWSTAYLSVAVGENFTIPNLKIRLDRPATRQEVAAMFTAAFRVDIENVGPVDGRYNDVKISTPYAVSIEALSRDGILMGDTDANGQPTHIFRPQDPINRAEVAKMVIAARAKYGMPGEGREPVVVEGEVVTYTQTGFSPATLRVSLGTTVTFRNETSEPLWVASNPHPTHGNYSVFDAEVSIDQGAVFSFTFTKIGTWGYHNHMHSSFGGTIIVE